MPFETISEVVSSRTTLRIADLVSKRPRTLNELSELTGVSIQAVLKHLKKLERLSIVKVRKVSDGAVNLRKAYYPGEVWVGDFSEGDLAIVKTTKARGASENRGDLTLKLEEIAEDALVQRSRIGEQVRKLARMIDELADGQGILDGILEAANLTDGEKLILYAVFTEDSLEQGTRVLSKYYGVKDGRRSIDNALAKARRIGKK